MENTKKLFLLDAYALIYRAYFAFSKNPRINSKGLNTSAVFGFTNTLIELLKKEKPTHIAVVFDTKHPTERHIEFPQYKAHREEMPEGLRLSLPYIDKLLEGFNILKIFKDGYEADDIIGTIAKKAEKEGFQVFMMTPDKDFAQLVSENIFIYKPANKWQSTTIMGINEVLQKFQIQRIDQVIDFLGMTGDVADNVPGIIGVGEKTAQKFIKEYDSMEGLFANTNKLKGKIKDKVESSREIGMLSKKLVTIITNVPIQINFSDMKINQKNSGKIRKLFEELEFRTLLKRVLPEQNHVKEIKVKNKEINNQKTNNQMDLFSAIVEEEKEDTLDKTTKKGHNCKIVKSENELIEILNVSRTQKKLALYIVTNNNKLKTKIIGFSITIKGDSFYIENSKRFINSLKTILEDITITKIGFDIKTLIKVLKTIDINLKGEFFDIQVAHYLLQPESSHLLDRLSESYLGYQFSHMKNLNDDLKSNETSSFFIKEIVNYATEKSTVIFQLSEILFLELQETNIYNLYKDIEGPLISVLANMELEGINLDVGMLNKYKVILSEDLKHLAKSIYSYSVVEFNISSPKQMGEILFDKLKLVKNPKKTKSGQYSTSEETLQKLKGIHPIIEKILEYRAVKKLLSTYVLALPELLNFETKRIHTTFNQSVASTGRLSSVNPNIQNIPIRSKRGMKVREAFIPKSNKYKILSADYSQIELRIMASISQDEAMLSAFNNNIDIHSSTAAKVYGVEIENVDREMRSRAKAVNFGIIYGISAFGLAQNIGISRTESQKIINQYFDEFPGVKIYMDKIINKAREDQYVETLMGRRRHLRDINSNNAVMRAVAERNAINAPIQGTAADIIKKAMIEIYQEITNKNMKSRMLIQVHDELIFDMHVNERNQLRELVKSKMENTIDLGVPLVIDLGEGINWLEAH